MKLKVKFVTKCCEGLCWFELKYLNRLKLAPKETPFVLLRKTWTSDATLGVGYFCWKVWFTDVSAVL